MTKEKQRMTFVKVTYSMDSPESKVCEFRQLDYIDLSTSANLSMASLSVMERLNFKTLGLTSLNEAEHEIVLSGLLEGSEIPTDVSIKFYINENEIPPEALLNKI